jgi:hypothetical protein
MVAVEDERLTIKGLIAGTVLTDHRLRYATPPEEYPHGQLIAFSDPSAPRALSVFFSGRSKWPNRRLAASAY